MNQTLQTIPAKDILTRPIEPLGFTIEGILPHGIFILAGSPKVGKSWLALDICNTVANGGNLWHFPSASADVLYLALEDNVTRLQKRLAKIAPDCDLDTLHDIHFATRAQKLGHGLSEQLTEFLSAHPSTKLIVIDTLQYIRNGGKSAGTYAGDYRDMDALRDIVSAYKLTLLLVTHTRKIGDADPVNLISGSTGLAGAADGVFVLEQSKRNGNAARLTIANRDTESHQFELRFDADTCRWQFVAETGGEESNLSDLLDLLLDETPSWRGTATQLCQSLAAIDPTFCESPIALSKTLKAQHEHLLKRHRIACEFQRSKASRTVALSRAPIAA